MPRHPDPIPIIGLLARYGANVAGPVWMAGSLLQLVIGALVLSPRQTVSAACNLAAPATYTVLGHRALGVRIGASFGLIGTELAVHPYLMAGEAATLFGFAAFTAGSVVGIWSHEMARRFGASPRALLRTTLGQPRRLMGLTYLLLCRLPIIGAGVFHHRGLTYLAPFVVWGIGDLMFSCSQERPTPSTFDSRDQDAPAPLK